VDNIAVRLPSVLSAAMPYTLLQANAFAGDLRDALQLLSPSGVTAPTTTGGPPRDLWATIELPEATALALAPHVAAVLGRRVVVTTVDEPRCWVTLAAPTGAVVGPIDGRAGGRVEEFASTFGDSRLPWKRRDVAWPTKLAGALGDQQVPARSRHTAAASVLGLPVPAGSVDAGSAVSAAGSVVPVVPADVSAVQRRYRGRRIVRRARTGSGVLAVAAGAVASIAWTDGDVGRLAVAGGAMAVLILVWLVLGRLLR
jgi:hypothetical protein